MTTLVLLEHDPTHLKPSSLAMVTAALQLGGEVHGIVIGAGCEAVTQAAQQVQGLTKILVADHPDLKNPLAEPFCDVLKHVAGSYTAIVAPATTFGKNILPRLAACLGVGQISDVIGIETPTTFRRPIYAGNAIQTVESRDPVTVMTIRSTAFEKAQDTGGQASIEKISLPPLNLLSVFMKLEESKSDRPELTSARVVISGGRGLQSGANFQLLEKLAAPLNAAIGASRAAVDAGFVPNDYQVGQTGKIVAPDLYIAIGISGAIQHLAGMKDSNVIVAINKDADAPIFQIADYGLVGDLFEIVPQLTQALSKKD
jgi:electron transfer flavoprotein alpha subunit